MKKKEKSVILLLTFILFFDSCYQLVDVIITDVNPAYIKPILSALGSNLKILEFLKCTQLDLQPLAYCTALEELTFFYRCSIEDGAAALPSGFLPALKFFFSDSCTCTAFFITKARLTSLKLNCCHVGTKVFIRVIYVLPSSRISET